VHDLEMQGVQRVALGPLLVQLPGDARVDLRLQVQGLAERAGLKNSFSSGFSKPRIHLTPLDAT